MSSQTTLRDLVVIAAQLSPQSLVLRSLQMDMGEIDNPVALCQTALNAFARPVADLTCHCRRSRQDAASPCLLLAEHALIHAGVLPFLLAAIATDAAAWFLRLAFILDSIQNLPTKCQGAVAGAKPTEIAWSSFVEVVGFSFVDIADDRQALCARPRIDVDLIAVAFEILVNRIAITDLDQLYGCQARFIHNPAVLFMVAMIAVLSLFLII